MIQRVPITGILFLQMKGDFFMLNEQINRLTKAMSRDELIQSLSAYDLYQQDTKNKLTYTEWLGHKQFLQKKEECKRNQVLSTENTFPHNEDMAKIREITQNEYTNLFHAWEKNGSTAKMCFVLRDLSKAVDKYVIIDNRTGDFLTENFPDKRSAIEFLNGVFDMNQVSQYLAYRKREDTIQSNKVPAKIIEDTYVQAFNKLSKQESSKVKIDTAIVAGFLTAHQYSAAKIKDVIQKYSPEALTDEFYADKIMDRAKQPKAIKAAKAERKKAPIVR